MKQFKAMYFDKFSEVFKNSLIKSMPLKIDSFIIYNNSQENKK